MGGRLKDKVAVVTGSGQGVGKAIVIALAKEAAKVVTNNRRPGTPGGDAETTAREITDMGGQAVPFFGDVSNFEVAKKLIQTAVDNFGKVDILVNNAGFAVSREIWEMTEEEWDSCVNASLKGSFNCIRHACGLMIKQRWGRIINCTSLSWLGVVGNCNYGAAKAGVVGLTRALALDLGKYGITCNAYAPSARTRASQSEGAKTLFRKGYEAGLFSKEYYESILNMPSPEAVGPVVAYLCTDEAANINGRVFHVKGGDVGVYSQPTEVKIIHKEGFWTLEELMEMVPRVLLSK